MSSYYTLHDWFRNTYSIVDLKAHTCLCSTTTAKPPASDTSKAITASSVSNTSLEERETALAQHRSKRAAVMCRNLYKFQLTRGNS